MFADAQRPDRMVALSLPVEIPAAFAAARYWAICGSAEEMLVHP